MIDVLAPEQEDGVEMTLSLRSRPGILGSRDQAPPAATPPRIRPSSSTPGPLACLAGDAMSPAEPPPAVILVCLGRFIDFYNHRRPHWSPAGQSPISRTPVNNLAGKNG